MSECSGVIACHRLVLPSADTVVMSARAYNAFILEFSKSHPHAPTAIQKETKPDKQQQCENVQEPSGHVGPLQRRKLAKGRHDGRSRADEAIEQC